MKKGCGTKKMAKGGAVKVSPRKAMAMGKKPAGVKKFAAGGAVMGTPDPIPKRKTGVPSLPDRPTAPTRSTGLPKPRVVPGPVTGTMTQQGMQQAAIQNAKNNAIQNAAQLASMQANRVNLAGPQTVRRFKKGGAVKKGCK